MPSHHLFAELKQIEILIIYAFPDTQGKNGGLE